MAEGRASAQARRMSREDDVVREGEDRTAGQKSHKGLRALEF